MITITKEIKIDVYEPQEAMKEYLWLHNELTHFKDKMFVNGKIDIEYLNSIFMVSYGVRVAKLDEYLKGDCCYYVNDDYTVFEQDGEIYVLSYIC